jgi:hypothetical protein
MGYCEMLCAGDTLGAAGGDTLGAAALGVLEPDANSGVGLGRGCGIWTSSNMLQIGVVSSRIHHIRYCFYNHCQSERFS